MADDDDHMIPLGQEGNLDLVGEALMQAIEPLPGSQGSLALVAAGLDILPAGCCAAHRRAALHQIRGELDRLLAEIEERLH